MDEYVYGFPLVMMDQTRQVMTAASTAGEYAAPINQFGRIRTYVDPDFKDVVRISVSSLWSHAFLDLNQEPMIVTIPDTGDRYIVMQALNMWTDDFASVGTRTPDRKSGDFLIAGPGWRRYRASGKSRIRSDPRRGTPGSWSRFLGPESPNGLSGDPRAPGPAQESRPLSAWGKPYTPPANVPVDPNVDLTLTPFDQVRLMTGEMFFERLAPCCSSRQSALSRRTRP